MNCIFCERAVTENSEEHIVPESLGNLYYILQSGAICRRCNNSFSDFESKALSKTMLGFERTRHAIPTKKGKPAQAQTLNIKFVGDPGFQKDRVTVFGIEEKDIEERLEGGKIKVRIQDFDKSEMATSKLLLKIGLESIYQSRKREIYKKHVFTELKNYLNKVDNSNWPLLTTKNHLEGFNSVPRFMDKKRLKDIRCEIRYKDIDANTFLLQFKYSVLSYVVNLKSRNIEWAFSILESDEMANLYPEYLRKRIPERAQRVTKE
jgi:hypothetical protein